MKPVVKYKHDLNNFIELGMNGYKDRKDYLKSLAEDYDLDYKDVVILATTLGESEDFDGLITSLEDWWHYV